MYTLEVYAFLCAGLLFYGSLYSVQEECGDGWPHWTMWGLWETRFRCGGPQCHDEGKMNVSANVPPALLNACLLSKTDEPFSAFSKRLSFYYMLFLFFVLYSDSVSKSFSLIFSMVSFVSTRTYLYCIIFLHSFHSSRISWSKVL